MAYLPTKNVALRLRNSHADGYVKLNNIPSMKIPNLKVIKKTNINDMYPNANLFKEQNDT